MIDCDVKIDPAINNNHNNLQTTSGFDVVDCGGLPQPRLCSVVWYSLPSIPVSTMSVNR